MNATEFSLPQVVAIVSITGFAIQQALQILDPFVMGGISKYKNSRPNKDLPGGMSDGDFKKAVMAFLSFLLGVVTVAMTDVRLLHYIRSEWGGRFADFWVTALVFGSGTEAVNIVLKFMGYIKDAQRPDAGTVIEVSIIPNAVTVTKDATFQFRVNVKNTTNTAVDWKVLHGNGGSINSNGLYTAPNTVGTFQITAISKADTSMFALATVTVSA